MCVSGKKCTKCGKVLPLEAFGKDKSKKDGLKPACKECRNASNRQYRKDNLEKSRESSRKYYQENPEYHKEKNKQYREDNPDYDKQYRQENPDKVRAIRHNRRARELNAPGHCTPEQLEARMAYYGHKCIYCGSDEDIQVEHMIPLAKGGTQWASNLAPACGTCNREKGTMPFLEFKAKKAKEAKEAT